jgi:hypothetical protein
VILVKFLIFKNKIIIIIIIINPSKSKHIEPGMMVHTCSPTTVEDDTGVMSLKPAWTT